jgi:plastocyanin
MHSPIPPRSTPFLLACAVLAAALPAAAANHTVRVRNNFFDPRDLTIQAGDTVTWTNEGINHNVRADDGSFRCANGCDNQGGNGNPSSGAWSVTLTFNNPGTIPYHCEVHGFSGGLGMAGTIEVQVQDVPGSLRFATTPVTVGEGAGSVGLVVQRVNGDDGPASVQYSTVSGSATAPADFMATSGVLNWADNDDDPKTLTVPIVDDSEVESQERFTVRLSDATGASLGNPSEVTVRINDNDENTPPPPPGEPGELDFAQDVYEVDEAAGTARIGVRRNGGASGAVSVQLTTAEGTADDSDDFQPVTATVSWGDGDAADKEVEVPLIDDTEDEGVETFKVAIASPTGGASLGSRQTAEAAIFDDDGGAGCSETDGRSLCLNRDDRFKVQVSFRTQQGDNGRGQILTLNRDSGLFSFLDANNAEILVKVLNTCSFSNRFWVFLAATTNQEFTLTVTDTQAGAVKYYTNELSSQPAETVLDLQAFATCP